MNPAPESPPKLILASESPYKYALLKKIIPNFDCIAPRIDEHPNPGESPHALAERLARKKAQTALSHLKPDTHDQWVLGCDQVAILHSNNGEILLNKPGSFERAKAQLTACSGEKTEFYTACSLVHANSTTLLQFADSYHLHFRELSEQQITRYLRREEPYDCAGSIKSEGLGVLLIERFEGRDPNTLVGLPLIKLIKQLDALGFDLL